jgi:hypothetical protein
MTADIFPFRPPERAKPVPEIGLTYPVEIPRPRTKHEAVRFCFNAMSFDCADFWVERFVEALESAGWAIAKRWEPPTNGGDDEPDCA